MELVKRFDVYFVNLNPTVGSEMNKMRPCVVISPNEANRFLNTVIVAPLTSTIKDYPTRVDCKVHGKLGQIVLDQLGSIDKRRLKHKIDALDEKTQTEVKRTLLNIFC